MNMFHAIENYIMIMSMVTAVVIITMMRTVDIKRMNTAMMITTTKVMITKKVDFSI
ncbi:hypothetical protein GALL_61600 [mine drainage metagenome]|uniref:Uncharacterized protein n=1 Tax=mine drainage metagenome TaxID=410659 RepID=A0A1J5T830_9ZZZZ